MADPNNAIFTRQAEKIISSDLANHPLRRLIDPATRKFWARSAFNPKMEFNVAVQAGHTTSRWAGGVELAIQDAFSNWLEGLAEFRGEIIIRVAIDIGGVPVDLNSAAMLERLNILDAGTVAKARLVRGWRPGDQLTATTPAAPIAPQTTSLPGGADGVEVLTGVGMTAAAIDGAIDAFAAFTIADKMLSAAPLQILLLAFLKALEEKRSTESAPDDEESNPSTTERPPEPRKTEPKNPGTPQTRPGILNPIEPIERKQELFHILELNAPPDRERERVENDTAGKLGYANAAPELKMAINRVGLRKAAVDARDRKAAAQGHVQREKPPADAWFAPNERAAQRNAAMAAETGRRLAGEQQRQVEQAAEVRRIQDEARRVAEQSMAAARRATEQAMAASRNALHPPPASRIPPRPFGANLFLPRTTPPPPTPPRLNSFPMGPVVIPPTPQLPRTFVPPPAPAPRMTPPSAGLATFRPPDFLRQVDWSVVHPPSSPMYIPPHH